MQYVIAALGVLVLVLGVYSWNVSGKLEDCQKAGAVDAREVQACAETVGVLREDITSQNAAADKAAADAAEIERKANERAAELLKQRQPRTAPARDAREMNEWYERLRSSLH